MIFKGIETSAIVGVLVIPVLIVRVAALPTEQSGFSKIL